MEWEEEYVNDWSEVGRTMGRTVSARTGLQDGGFEGVP